MDQDSDTLPDDAPERIIPHLTKDTWVSVLVADSPEEHNGSLSISYF